MSPQVALMAVCLVTNKTGEPHFSNYISITEYRFKRKMYLNVHKSDHMTLVLKFMCYLTDCE